MNKGIDCNGIQCHISSVMLSCTDVEITGKQTLPDDLAELPDAVQEYQLVLTAFNISVWVTREELARILWP